MYLMFDKCTLTEYMNNHIEDINHYLWLGYTVYNLRRRLAPSHNLKAFEMRGPI